jgi:hypothetical protein
VVVAEKIVELDPITCSKCKLEIGKIVLIGEVEWIRIGGLILRLAHGNCVNCGEPYHYEINDKILKDLIRRTNSK